MQPSPLRATVSAGQLVEGVTYFPPPPHLKAWPHVSRWTWDHWTHWLATAHWSPAQISQYQREREQYGVGIPQTDKRGKVVPGGTIRWLYLPTPKQVLLHNALAPNVLWGGAAGGSKSTGLRWDAYKRCLMLPGYRVLLMRRLATELFEHHLDLARREVEIFGARVVENEIRFPNGSLIRGGHCQHPGDELRFLSIEYDEICIDELATLEQSQANEIMSRARSSKEGVTALVRCTSNPGGAHTLYVVDRWITKTISKADDPFYDPRDFTYIPARLYDNPYLMDQDGTFRTYEKRLGPLPPQRRDQLLNGDWSAITGQFFPEFHDRDIGQGGHITRLDLPHDTRVLRAIDWGYNAPGCCLWIAILPDGHIHIPLEYRFQQTLAQDVAEKIDRETKDHGWKAIYTVIDPSTFSKTGHVGQSVAETFARQHVACQAGDNARNLGWQRLRHWFSNAPDGRPWMTIDPACRYLRRTIPSLISDPKDPEDVFCWAAGTPVSTPTGPRPIEDLLPGDLVTTPLGTRPAVRTYCSGTSALVTITLADGRVLRGTPNHPVFVRDRGLVPLEDLVAGDDLMEASVWSKWWSIAACGIAAMKDACTTFLAMVARVCIGKFGWIPEVASRPVITFTTLMGTTTTTIPPTWLVSTDDYIVASMPESATEAMVTLDEGSRSGVSRTWDRSRSATTLERCASALRDTNRSAVIVAALSWPCRWNAIVRQSVQRIQAVRIGSARSAANRSSGGAASRCPSVPARIVAVGSSANNELVYNLTVAEAHLFYANGVLSKNTEGDDHAADALRYGVMSRPSPARTPLQSAFGPNTIGYLRTKGDRHPGSRYWRKTGR